MPFRREYTFMNRVEVKPEMLRWARERAGRDVASLLSAFPKFQAWESGELKPTLKQLERFARTTYTPVGYLLLQTPPVERVPISDFRTIAAKTPPRPSPNLLDTLYLCQARQDWYHDFARSNREEPLAFVGSASLGEDVSTAAARIREALHLDVEERSRSSTWMEALGRFVAQMEALGVLVMVNGIVGNNRHRKLDPDEFRGFALVDELAPLVFVNGADTKSAQMFTLAHELAHIWLGSSALSNAGPARLPSQAIERWCNQVAAEVLVPLDALNDVYRRDAAPADETARLVRHFKVSALVVLRRLLDVGGLTRQQFNAAYTEELKRVRALTKGRGGDFYRTETARVSRRFAQALVMSTLEGQTLHRDALRLLGIAKLKTFHELAHRLEVL